MPTTTTGLFFLARERPQATDDAGRFTLVMRVKDNQGPGRVEPYLLHWEGEGAREWWHTHRHQLQPGTPLQLTLHNPRSFAEHGRAPETRALVVHCELAPVAPSWQKHAAATAQAA